MTKATEPTLHALADRPTPADIARDADSARKLSDRAIENLWSVTEPCIIGRPSQALNADLCRFAQHFEIAEADLGRLIKSCRFLMRRASAADLPVEKLAEDAHALFGQAPGLCRLLVAQYEPLKEQLRQELYLTTLAKHGALLDEIDWRLDQVSLSSDAPKVQRPVAILTLAYREEGRTKRKTLQVTRSGLEKLRLICEALLRLQPEESDSPRQ